ncbi:hypothetical protein Tco_1408573 [Tanacetum coccineum]
MSSSRTSVDDKPDLSSLVIYAHPDMISFFLTTRRKLPKAAGANRKGARVQCSTGYQINLKAHCESEEDRKSSGNKSGKISNLIGQSKVVSSPTWSSTPLQFHFPRVCETSLATTMTAWYFANQSISIIASKLPSSTVADLFVFTRVLKTSLLELTLKVSQTSTLTTGVSSLIPSSSRVPTLLGHVVNLLAIPAPLLVLSHCSLAANLGNGCLADCDRGLEGTGSSVGNSRGSAEVDALSSSSRVILLKIIIIVVIIRWINVINCLTDRQDGQQDLLRVPPYPLTGFRVSNVAW